MVAMQTLGAAVPSEAHRGGHADLGSCSPLHGGHADLGSCSPLRSGRADRVPPPTGREAHAEAQSCRRGLSR